MKKKREEIPNTLIGLIYKILFYRTKEFFIFIILILVAIIVLQLIGFDFTIFRRK